ncbi:hypothetical protein, unlikely [Trypanosoma brucei gambiense DAL972]|uniref:Uncharacterized protein n=1 Tax=Trypanosoma brucei gambiense (strain MHOM/CI/86/DAL972) TaxID=679716 RepID=C9ZZW1_TRYB9|nr:hypothetical protein, unlikely [Trypanosoma brucei gambiense DAL972]CBH16519.1 hypothetical protein, unlikely [Trypanosoma brucei gambiense DAL972]|eukprot:XP_011778783.1 hypothetical protein, unlikely [Trypanosoma brucei gambiense DAL972]
MLLEKYHYTYWSALVSIVKAEPRVVGLWMLLWVAVVWYGLFLCCVPLVTVPMWRSALSFIIMHLQTVWLCDVCWLVVVKDLLFSGLVFSFRVCCLPLVLSTFCFSPVSDTSCSSLE